MSNNKIKLKSVCSYFDEICDEPRKERIGLYDIYYEISTKLYDFRIEKGWSQKKLAEVLGVTQAMVSKLESGEYNYTIEHLWKVAKKLGWKLNVNFEGSHHDNYSVGYECDPQEAREISTFGLEVVG